MVTPFVAVHMHEHMLLPFLQKKKDDNQIPVSPMYLGLFLFLVVGSAFFQILQATQSGQSNMVQ